MDLLLHVSVGVASTVHAQRGPAVQPVESAPGRCRLLRSMRAVVGRLLLHSPSNTSVLAAHQTTSPHRARRVCAASLLTFSQGKQGSTSQKKNWPNPNSGVPEMPEQRGRGVSRQSAQQGDEEDLRERRGTCAGLQLARDAGVEAIGERGFGLVQLR